MHENDSHDLSDDADYAASKLHGSAGMAGSSSSKQVTLSADEGAEIVYKKDNVAIHPTQYASERISGRLKLIKQGGSLFMTWVPYKGHNSRLSEEDRNLYAIRAVSFSEISSIRRQTPALAWHYIIVVLSSGMAFPPLYFYNGGVREFVATIKKHVNLVRSVEDANVFLLNDFQDPLQRTLTSLDLPRAVSISKSSSPSVLAAESPTSVDQDGMAGVSSDDSSNHQHHGKHRQKYNDTTCDLSIQVLEKFSYVTKLARDTTTQLFREHGDGFVSNERDKLAHKSNDDPHSHPITEEKDPPEVPVPSDPLAAELEKSSLLWGKPRQEPLGSEEWAAFLDSEGRVLDSGALKKRIFYGGVEQGVRQEIWPFLLEYHAYDSTCAERDYLAATKNVEYETIKSQWKSITPQQERRFTKFKERKSLIEKDVVRTDRSISFYDEDDNPNITLLHDILLTYSFYNFDLGYCQGMSDLLSPILFVMKDESESFWCFVSLMERLGPNFNRDQNGMHSQFFALSKLVEILDSPLHNYFQQNDCLNYFFCFRWILIQFKREFEFDTTLRLWEVLWTHHLSEHLHLYVCVAVLKQHRTKIMGEQMEFDTLLKYINELSDHIDLDSTLRDAEALCIYAGENGAACIPPGTPPSLPIEDVSERPELEDDVL